MSREQYTACMTPAMRAFPKGIPREERSLLFCMAAKKCSGKVSSDAEARSICSQPKPPKPEGTRKRRSKKTECPEFDPAELIPHCEKQLTGLVKTGELPTDTDISGICQLILG